MLFICFTVVPVSAPAKRKTPVPLPPQLAFLAKETAGSPVAERPESTSGVFPV